MLEFESSSPDANITTGGDALWWAIVTITTVGYGDKYPVTALGRLTGVFVMFAGVGIIGALASILASILVPPRSTSPRRPAAAPAGEALRRWRAASIPTSTVEAELAGLRAEIEALRLALTPDRPAAPG